MRNKGAKKYGFIGKKDPCEKVNLKKDKKVKMGPMKRKMIIKKGYNCNTLNT